MWVFGAGRSPDAHPGYDAERCSRGKAALTSSLASTSQPLRTSGVLSRYVQAVPNTDPDRPSSPLPRWSSQAGFLASALAVFTAGWVGMHSNDWRVMVASAVVAVAASALAARFRLR